MAHGITAKELAETLKGLPEAKQLEFIRRLPPAASARAKELLSEYATQEAQDGGRVDLLPHQRLPEPHMIRKGHLFAGGRGAGKTLALANYIARLAEKYDGLRARVISPTLGDAVNGVALDPYSGILAHSPAATYKASGIEGARILWPNGSVCFLVGTPTLKDVDRLRALTNIDVDAYDEAAANPQLTAMVQQANLSRRGRRLDHPIWIAATTPRPVPQYKKWLKDTGVTVTHARTIDNPHTPDEYREYAESLKGTALYNQEILGEVLDDIAGALWTHADVSSSEVTDPEERQRLIEAMDRIVVGVDPPTGHGTCGIVVAGVTTAEQDPTGTPRLVILDDFSVEDGTPAQWGAAVVQAHITYGAHIVAERNQGGLMVESTIRHAAEAKGLPLVPVTLAHAAISKERRAAPMAILWEVKPQRALIAPPEGNLARMAVLIDQMTSWIPGTFSPDHLDAAAWAAAYLSAGGKASKAVLQKRGTLQSNRTVSSSFRGALMGRRR